MATKTTCPISRETFADKAPGHIDVSIAGMAYSALKHSFNPGPKTPYGSMGYNLTTKTVLTIDGVKVECQVGMNVTVIGSGVVAPRGIAGTTVSKAS